MILYCKACDLGFCDRHRDAHGPFSEEEQKRHALAEDARVDFCCVCAGIYRPLPS